MKICAISDLHGHQIDIPKCNVLVIAGDVSSILGNAFWFENYFINYYLAKQKNNFDKCFITFGNHDDKIDISKIDLPENIEVLNGKSSKYKGLTFFGSPYCKYSPEIIESTLDLNEDQLKDVFSNIPLDTDILITHSPPYGFGDTVKYQSYHLGSMSLMDRVRIVKPKVHLFGHIHTGKKYEKHNGTKFYNVSVLDDNYEVAYKPTIINMGL